MLIDGIVLSEGSDILNMTLDTGTLVDRGNLTPTNGELFYQTDADPGMYLYRSGTWELMGTKAEVDAAATSDTGAEILAKLITVDGTGSLLDADTVDGIEASLFLRNDQDSTLTGNLTITGTVDGRDVAADGTKLDGIDASATDDQTAAEILAAIKTVDGPGSGLDADTLDGISSLGFVQDTGVRENVNANTAIGSAKVYRPGAGSTNFPGSINGTLLNLNNSDTNQQLYLEHGIDTVGAELWFRADNASAMDAPWAKVWTDQNDGAGSGLDADLLDGLTSASFARSDAGDTLNGGLYSIETGAGSLIDTGGTHDTLEIKQNDQTADAFMTFHIANVKAFHVGLEQATGHFVIGGFSLGNNSYSIWHEGRQGAGTGMDADLLDGIEGSAYLRSDVADIKTAGSLTFNDNVLLALGSSDDVKHGYFTGNYHTDITSGDWFIRNGGGGNRFAFGISSGDFTAFDGTIKGENVISTGDAFIGGNGLPGGTFANGKALGIGDNDTGIRQDGDGILELWANNQEVINIQSGGVQITKSTTIEGFNVHTEKYNIVNVANHVSDLTGSSDMTSQFQTIIDSLAGSMTRSIFIPFGAKIQIDSDITVHEGINIIGEDTGSDNVISGSTILGNGGGLILTGSNKIEGITFLKSGASTTPAALVGFADTAVKAASGELVTDVTIRDCSFFGFNYAIDFANTATVTQTRGRLFFENIKIDCVNGIKIHNSRDTIYLNNIHGWPFLGNGILLSDLVNGVNRDQFIEIGISAETADWVRMNNCFCHSYKNGFKFQGVTKLTMNGGGYDYERYQSAVAGSRGLSVDGFSSGMSFTGCHFAGGEICVQMYQDGVTNFSTCTFENGKDGLLLCSGKVTISSCQFAVGSGFDQPNPTWAVNSAHSSIPGNILLVSTSYFSGINGGIAKGTNCTKATSYGNHMDSVVTHHSAGVVIV